MGSESDTSRPERAWWVRDPGTPYEVSRLKIMEYAQAIGDPNPVYRDLDAARQAGYPDVIAPPAFAVVVALPASIAAVRDAVPGTGYPVIVHVEQRFEYARPIRAGDVLHAESAVIGIRELRGATMITTRTEIRTAHGEQICSAWATLAKLPSVAKNDRELCALARVNMSGTREPIVRPRLSPCRGLEPVYRRFRVRVRPADARLR